MKDFFLNDVKFLFTGYTPGKAQSDKVQCRTIVIIASIVMLTTAVFSVVNYLYGRDFLAIMLGIVTVLLTPCFILLRSNRYLPFVRNLFMVNSAVILMTLFIDGGIEGSAFMWTLVFPYAAFLLMGLPVGWFWVAAYLATMQGLIVAHFSGLFVLPYHDERLIFFPAAFLFFSFIAATFELHFERLQVRYEESITQLKYLQGNLEKGVVSRTAALQRSNIKLRNEVVQHKETAKALQDSEERFYQAQKMEAVGTLVGGIAHDFNNMLAGINANLFLIKKRAGDDSGLLTRAENVEQLVLSASDMIKQLLTFARKDHVTLEYFDLEPFIKEAYKLATVSISEEINIRYENKSEEEELVVQGNGTQLQQVLMNMINNARDAVKGVDAPSIIIQLDRYEPSERFRDKNPSLTADDYVVLSIIDNGMGIPSGRIDNIFEPFFTTKEIGKGTGLGLAMCYGAIQSHQGTIKVQSELDKGTAFKIYLPVAQEYDFEEAMTTTGINVMGNGETILLVDDDQKLRASQRDALQALGYSIIEAQNGREAVRQFEECNSIIDLILMDLTMPVMGGIKAAEHIRAIKNDTPIIFVTGYDKDDTINGQSLPNTEDFVLEKPYTMDKLNSVIQKKMGTR